MVAENKRYKKTSTSFDYVNNNKNIYTVPFPEGDGAYWQYLPPSADSSDFGLLGSNVPKNERFHAQDAHEPSCKISHR